MSRRLIGAGNPRRGVGVIPRQSGEIEELKKTPRSGTTTVHKHSMASGGGVSESDFNDHSDRHDPQDGADALDTAAASEIAGVQAAGAGSAHSFARSDHAHQIQHGIADNHLVTVDAADAADNDYAKFTGNGLEGRSYVETKSDLGLTDTPTRAIEFIIADADEASTTIPKCVLLIPFACTITAIKIKLGKNETCGATSLIADVHKILLANSNTDGQGTTIYTTQANRPTISNGNMYQACTISDVTSVAAGDWLAVYIDQAGTNVTNCTICITATTT